MAEKLIKTIIQLRRDTEENLLKVADTLVLRAGEPCVTLDGEHKGQIKMGDGTSTWGQLPYMSAEAAGINVDGTSISNQDGILTILGYGAATQGQQPRKGANGLEWFTPALTDEQLTNLNEAVIGEDGLVNKVESLEDTVTNPNTGLNKVVSDLTNTVTSLSNNLTNNYDTSTEVDEKISSAISSTYKAGGSVENIGAITVDAEHAGYVYDVTTAFTTTEAFVEGAGHEYPAGTNVAVIEVPGEPVTYKLDTMSGFVDLSNYVEESVQGTNGTSYVWNEQSGGGARFVHNDGTESFVGVNDGGENGMVAQIYADKNVDGNWIGTRLNVYQKGAFYFNAEDKASGSYVGDDPAHEIATLGDIPEDKVYYTTKLCQLTTGAGASQIEAAIGSWDALYQAIMDNKIIVDTQIDGQGDATWSNPRPAVTASAQGNVVIHLTFHITTQRMIHCEIQNVGGSPLAIAVDDYYIGDASVTNNNKTIIDSLPTVIATGAEFSRDVYNNYIDVKVATKQENGTYVASGENVRISIPGADMTHAGLMTAANINKLGTIQPNAEPNVINMIMIDGKKQPIAAKSVNISCAMTDGSEAGVVYSSADMNKVSVDGDGIMEVNNISVEKLVVPDETVLVLDGGTSSVNA